MEVVCWVGWFLLKGLGGCVVNSVLPVSAYGSCLDCGWMTSVDYNEDGINPSFTRNVLQSHLSKSGCDFGRLSVACYTGDYGVVWPFLRHEDVHS